MKLKITPLAIIVCAVICLTSNSVLAQGDVIYQLTGGAGASKVECKVVNMSPDGIIAEVKGVKTTIPPWELRSVSYNGQPGSLPGTTDRIEEGNYAQGLADVLKLDGKGNPFVAHELAYLKAVCEGNLALRGGFGAREAGTSLNNFLTKYKKSYHFYPATELKGKLLYGLNLLDLASAEFTALTKSDWPEYQLLGHYNLAQTALAQAKYDVAMKQCEQVISAKNNDDESRNLKLLARCLKAKAQCLAGNPGSAEADLKKIIKVENPDNQAVFGSAYNALGVLNLKAGRLKEAREKFLITHLLMYSESDLHAEALHYLSEIWPKLENTDEASKARELLKSRYRNSYWAQITE